MQPIPEPEVLDPDRIVENARDNFTNDDKSPEDLLREALHQSCDYAKSLWHHLDTVRGYLWETIPSDPRDPGPHRISASPTGPTDEQGWARWIEAFAAVNSVLCGPHGDSGFGLTEARRAAKLRRDAPNLLLESDREVDAEAVERRPASRPASAKAAAVSAVKAAEDERSAPHPSPWPVPSATPARPAARTAALAVLALLAVRGLLPRKARAS